MRQGLVVFGVVAVLGVTIGAVLIAHNNAAREAARQRLAQELAMTDKALAPATQPVLAPADADPPAPVEAPPAPKIASPVPQKSVVKSDPSKKPAKPDARAAQAAKGKQSAPPAAGIDPPQEKPIARIALSYVGEDPAAEAVWVASINDPNVSAHDRSDLIEDLNEEGFDDPKNITKNDLPLIENRLALIEQLAPSSMDDTNAAAFAEAYKDLSNMRARLAGQ